MAVIKMQTNPFAIQPSLFSRIEALTTMGSVDRLSRKEAKI
jgi:hypothetical protein